MWAPHRPLVIALLAGTIVLLGGLYWLASLTRTADQTDQWVRALLAQLSLAKQPALPSTWTAKGIFAAIERNPRESLFYLGIVVGNALFASWVTINILGRTWPSAYSRAVQGRQVPFIRRGWLTELACLPARWLLPTQLHRVLLKDLRHFARDPKQWTQMLIMFGLLVIYVANLRRLPLDFDQPGVKSVMMFINLTAVSLILATFTSRFVFPMLSLESQQLWLLELLPIRRTTLLVMKFLFSLTLTTAAALIVMGAAVYMLDLPPLWALVSLGLCLSVCVGLSGLATGLGARFPVLGQRNPARIAAGFGGTFNLVVSMVFVMLVMAGVATLHLTENRSTLVINLPQTLSPEGVVILSLLLALGVVVATGALLIGAHHFRRLET